MEAVQEHILDVLDSHGSIKDTRDLTLPGQSTPAISQDAQMTILGALNSLASREVSRICTCMVISHKSCMWKMITYATNDILSHVLTPEGAQISLEGSHEARVWEVLPLKGQGAPMSLQDIKGKVGDETAKIGQGNAFKNKWIGKEGDGFVKLVSKQSPKCHPPSLIASQVPEISDTTKLELREVDSTGTLKAGEKVLSQLRKRKLIAQK